MSFWSSSIFYARDLGAFAMWRKDLRKQFSAWQYRKTVMSESSTCGILEARLPQSWHHSFQRISRPPQQVWTTLKGVTYASGTHSRISLM